MGSIRRANLDDPDALRQLPLLDVYLARIGSTTLGRGVLQPGWRWSEHLKPVMGTASCPVHHVQLLMSGRFAVRMEDGEEAEFGPGDVMDVPPGHDAWVAGDEPAVLLDFGGNIDLLGVIREHERIVTTLLMTDIVDPTLTARQLGDEVWKQVHSDHNRLVRAQLIRFGGFEVNTTGGPISAAPGDQLALMVLASGLMWANMLRPFHVGKARTR